MVNEHVYFQSSLRKTKCNLCEKEFYRRLGNDYAYKTVKGMKTMYFCSWSCLRKAQRNVEDKKKRKQKI